MNEREVIRKLARRVRDRGLKQGIELAREELGKLEPFIREECGPDEALQQRLREELTRILPQRHSLPRPERPRFGEYEIEKELGRGGMGVVYKARQPGLDRWVALKTLLTSSGATDQQQRARFLREGKALGSIHHAGVVTVYQASEWHGQPYIAMEYIDGETLEKFLNHAPQAPALSARLVAALAVALQAAHDEGLVHRDLKPSNVLLRDWWPNQGQSATEAAAGDPTQERVSELDGGAAAELDLKPVVIDFGLARHADERESQRVTRSDGGMLGTPQYMAPEQVRGRIDEVHPPADIHALGVILYEMITGRPPFLGKNTHETLTMITEAEPLHPRLLSPGCPPDLATICLKCLEKAPQRRYKTAGALADDLRAYLAGDPIKARAVGNIERGLKWVWKKKNRPLAAALAGVAVVAVVALVVFVAWIVSLDYARDLQTQKDRADQLKDFADSYRADAERLTALLQLKTGSELCDSGEAGRGLLFIAQALEKCPESAPSLRRSIRAGLASAEAKLHTLRAAYPVPQPTISMALSPDEKSVLLGGNGVFLVDLANGKRHFEQPPAGEISDVAFSPGDGKLFATSTMKGVVRVCETATGRDVGARIVHSGTVKSVSFSRDGKTLLVAAQKGVALQCYDVATRQPVGPIWSCRENVYAAAYSPVAPLVATAVQENTARLWNPNTGLPVGPPLNHPGAVFAVAFSPDGKWLVTGCRDGGARLWDVATRKPIGHVIPHRAPLKRVRFSADGKLLLTCSEDGAARLWEIATGDLIGQVLYHPGPLHSALLTRDNHILTVGFEGTLRVWRVADERKIVKVLPCSGAVGAIAFSPDGKRVLTGCEDSEERQGEARLWDARTGLPLSKDAMPQAESKPGQVMTVAFGRDGALALTGGNNNQTRVWNTATASPAQPPWLHKDIVAAIAFTPDGKHAAISGRNGVVEVRDLSSGEVKSNWKAEEREGFWIWSLAFLDDETLLTGGGVASQFWRWRDGHRIGKRMEHGTEARTTLLSPNKRLVLTCSHDMKARVWSARDGEPITDWLVHKGVVLGGAFRPDSKAVATASADGTLRLWEIPSGKLLTPAILHDGQVQSLAFSPDGKTLVTGCADGTARLWSADDGAPLGAVLRHRGPVDRVAFSPDGLTVLTGSKDRKARLWNPPPPMQVSRERVMLWAQVLTGMEFDKDGTAQVLPRAEWESRKRKLEEEGQPR